MEGGQDSGEGPGHTVRWLPGLQDLLSLDGRLGHSWVGWSQAGPGGRLQPLENRRAGAVGVTAVGRSWAGAQAGGASQIAIG